MADKKISALTAAATPLAGSEVLPIVQSGSTVKVPVANLTIGRVMSASGVQVTPSAAAGDILEFATFGGAGYLQAYNNVSGIAALPIDFYTGTSVKMRLGANSGDLSLNIGNLVVGTANKGIDFSANANAPGMTSEVLNWYEEGTWTPDFSAWTTAPTSVSDAKYTRIGRQVTVVLTALNGVVGSTGEPIGSLPFTAGAAAVASFRDVSGGGTTTFGAVSGATTQIGSITAANFTGLFWTMSCTYFV